MNREGKEKEHTLPLTSEQQGDKKTLPCQINPVLSRVATPSLPPFAPQSKKPGRGCLAGVKGCWRRRRGSSGVDFSLSWKLLALEMMLQLQ